jgi:hypothetical protein
VAKQCLHFPYDDATGGGVEAVGSYGGLRCNDPLLMGCILVDH